VPPQAQPLLPFEEPASAVERRATGGDPAAPRPPMAFLFVRSPRARRYVLRLRPDGVVRVTIPARGTRREAVAVIERHRDWLERQWRLRAAAQQASRHWQHGTRIYYRGREVPLSVAPRADGVEVRFGDQVLTASDAGEVREAVERHLRAVAERELEPRLRQLAARHGLEVRGVTIRSQRTRWGSCSRQGRVSLNWRLVQMPPFVSDYILLHELMHLKQANHSRRFWREVARVCPTWREAEAWLRREGKRLM
jgi:hypothetical protein